LGDNGQEPPGKFFQNGNEYNNIFWNMLDQVIISHEMVNKFNLESLKIIGKTRDKSLLTKLGRPNKKIGSDHLPLFFELLEKE
jgi:hypothetical protein